MAVLLRPSSYGPDSYSRGGYFVAYAQRVRVAQVGRLQRPSIVMAKAPYSYGSTPVAEQTPRRRLYTGIADGKSIGWV